MSVYHIVTFAVSFLIATEEIVLKGSYEVPSGKVSFANFIQHHHHKLSTVAPIEVIKSSSDFDCALSCLKVPSCRSTNFGVGQDVHRGTHRCELLRADRCSAPDNFTSNQDFHHFSIPVSRSFF